MLHSHIIENEREIIDTCEALAIELEAQDGEGSERYFRIEGGRLRPAVAGCVDEVKAGLRVAVCTLKRIGPKPEIVF